MDDTEEHGTAAFRTSTATVPAPMTIVADPPRGSGQVCPIGHRHQEAVGASLTEPVGAGCTLDYRSYPSCRTCSSFRLLDRISSRSLACAKSRDRTDNGLT